MVGENPSNKANLVGRLGALWGVAGVSLLLSFAVYRLTVITIDAFASPFQWYHWLVFFGNMLFMAHSEGYKGFQKGFAPRVAARARYLQYHPRLSLILVAPLFCMGYFFATRERLVTTYALTVGIVLLVIIFHQISQPWRGILDAGVVVGLSWGIASLIWFAFEALGTGKFDVSAEVPVEKS
ncbi:MAG: hypothetical protein OEY09_10500 [Gammaproteobacteria bacterium]|nr:hypothetical protein [Gammaproteobacteria bacterium]